MEKNQIKIALVEDDDNLRLLVTQRLKNEGFLVVQAADGLVGEELILKEKPHIVLLDWMLPGQSGEEVCTHIRAKDNNCIVIMLTAKAQEVDKINAYNFGVTDYITKPFSMDLLMAMLDNKIKYLVNSDKSEIYQFSGMEHHPNIHSLIQGDKKIELTILENRILTYFLKNVDKVINRDELMMVVWGYNSDVNTRTLDMHIVRLRKKIEENPEKPQILQTIRGAGYKFNLM